MHQGRFSGKGLEIAHVIGTITRAVNVIRAKYHSQFKMFLEELNAERGDLSYHREVRWLKQEKVQKRFLSCVRRSVSSLKTKGKTKTFLCEVTFLCDNSCHLHSLILQLSRSRIISDMCGTVRVVEN